MATITPTVETTNQKYRKATWTGAVNGDDFQAVSFGPYPIQNVQIIGTADGAATGLEGSNDGGTTWVDLTTDGSTAITGTGVHYIWENVERVRPKTASGGASGTSLSYIIGAPAILG